MVLPCVGVFGPPMSKFVFARLARMVCSEDTRVYTGSGGTSLRPVRCCSYYWHLVCNRGYKQTREGEDPKSLVEEVNGCRELACRSAMCSCRALVFRFVCPPPFMGRPAFSFIGEGKARVTAEEKEKNKREKASRIVGSFYSFMWVPPIL